MILELKNITKKFGGVTAINDTSFCVEEKQIYGLIGPNGAGKTTLFNIITGNYKPTNGQVFLDGKNITNKKNYKIVRDGIARTFQNIRLFSSMSVEENVLIGLDSFANYTYLESMFRLPRYYSQEKKIKEKAYEVMEFLGILEYKDELATSLSYGVQRKVEIARALSRRNKVAIPQELKRRFCKGCGAFLKRGMNSDARVEGKLLLLECKECGKIRKLPKGGKA